MQIVWDVSLSNQTKSFQVGHLSYDSQKCFFLFFFIPLIHIYYIFIATISIITRLCTCLHSASFCYVPSQQPHTEKYNNPQALLMDCDIALILSVQLQQLPNAANRQLTPHLCSVNYSIWTQHSLNESLIVLSSQLQTFGAVITETLFTVCIWLYMCKPAVIYSMSLSCVDIQGLPSPSAQLLDVLQLETI